MSSMLKNSRMPMQCKRKAKSSFSACRNSRGLPTETARVKRCTCSIRSICFSMACLNTGSWANDLGDVVVAAQQAVRVEEKNLFRAVRCDVRGELHLEPAPSLAVLPPGLQLLRQIPRLRESERSRQVVPQRVAQKVGEVKHVPRRIQDMTVKCCPRVRPLRRYLPRRRLNRDPIWGERRAQSVFPNA